MRDVLEPARTRLDRGEPFALAVLVDAYASAPREVGTAMLVDAAGQVFGNVSAGCVDGAVYELCLQALASGESTRSRYGISDERAFAAALTCGGVIDVLVVPVVPGSRAAEALRVVIDAVERREAVALGIVTDAASGGGALLAVTDDDSRDRAVGDSRMLAAALADLRRAASAAAPVTLRYADVPGDTVEESGTTEVLAVPFPHAPRLIVVGAVEFSVALARLGAASGFEVTVCDPREVFARAERFPDATVVHDQPGRYLAATPIDARTAICVLTHDERFDIEAIAAALASPAAYVGAMGSRRTHDDRLVRLRTAGVTDAALARLRSPIGLALGGRTPEETALSILAEIVLVRSGGSGEPLRETHGPIHPDAVVPGGGRRTDAPAAVCADAVDAVVARWDGGGIRL
ncbi:XdhC family protein [Microbacterium aurantiacum]|uniref:XdhC family protein n=1 Tax=Microbacterium aurantiacum TaxID=162393 RepID=A0ABT8FNB9_9MICO|nr:XdhC/CoxI family protein [Microbacterium aurantiacum]MDN4462812.1 XdhC family protein [Microbacterium aurantiacum]